MSSDPDIPEGFVRNPRLSPLTAPWEPLWMRELERSVQIGLRVAEAHCNGRGFAHGGLLASLADNAMGYSVSIVARSASPVTVRLSIDYMRSVHRGQWLQVEPRVVRVGKNLGVVDALITADEAVVARADATFWLAS